MADNRANYVRILQYLAQNQPELASERHVHASLLELLAQFMRPQRKPLQIDVEVVGHNSKQIKAEIYQPPSQPKISQPQLQPIQQLQKTPQRQNRQAQNVEYVPLRSKRRCL